MTLNLFPRNGVSSYICNDNSTKFYAAPSSTKLCNTVCYNNRGCKQIGLHSNGAILKINKKITYIYVLFFIISFLIRIN